VLTLEIFLVNKPEPYIYTSLNEVPKAISIYKGARLNLTQCNHVIARSHDLATEPSLDEEGNPTHFNPSLGLAWQEFEAEHRIENNLWVKN
jgi:hypothetical protein